MKTNIAVLALIGAIIVNSSNAFIAEVPDSSSNIQVDTRGTNENK